MGYEPGGAARDPAHEPRALREHDRGHWSGIEHDGGDKLDVG
jgi:hypothetical protein